MRTTRTLAISLATLAGVGVGSFGIVAATSDETPRAPAGTERETDDDDVEEQDPQLGGSIQIDEIEDESDADEDARLQELATVSEADAAAAAVAEYSGDIVETELGNENGSVVWEFEIVGADGSTVEVKIDAGNAKVLDVETDDDDDGDDDDDDNDVDDENEDEDDAASDG